MTTVGYPYLVKEHVLYVRDGGLICIPKALVTDIKGLRTMPSQKIPLAPDDTRFRLFEETWTLRTARVRIEYLVGLPDDPALPPDLRGGKMPSLVEGLAWTFDDAWVTILLAESVADISAAMRVQTPGSTDRPLRIQKQRIPRKDVLDIVFLGPRPVQMPDKPADVSVTE